MFKPTHRVTGLLATAAMVGAIAVAAPSLALAQAAADRAPVQLAATEAAHAGPSSAERVEQRITDLHNKLHITAAQEAQWSAVAQVMRDNAVAIRSRIEERTAGLKSMNAVDDLKSYHQIADAHADGLKQLIPAFETLYAGMMPDQQKRADRVFAAHERVAHQSDNR
jgi:protein CpxP